MFPKVPLGGEANEDDGQLETRCAAGPDVSVLSCCCVPGHCGRAGAVVESGPADDSAAGSSQRAGRKGWVAARQEVDHNTLAADCMAQEGNPDAMEVVV